jgi:hypothetical protein
MSAKQAVEQCGSVLTGKLSRLGHDCDIVCFLGNLADLRDKARNTPVTIAVCWAVVCALVGDWMCGLTVRDGTRQMADFAREPSDSQIDGGMRIGSKRQAAGARRAVGGGGGGGVRGGDVDLNKAET